MIEVSEEVVVALEQGLPVVALESAVISHGLPKSVACDCAFDMEAQIRAAGAVPAMVAVLEGKVKVGLTACEVRLLACSDGVAKVNAGSIPIAAASGGPGATTVSATVFIADSVGIEVAATGGIGGVHRNWRDSLDISADLHQLTRSSVTLICSGPKAIVDPKATTEWLETHNLPVVGLRTSEMPAFYSRDSGIRIPVAEGPNDVADIWLAKRELGQGGALIVTVPPPVEPESDISAAIEQALSEAADAGLSGPGLTPFLLGCVAELTNGDSVRVNLALLKNNARVAGEIAAAISAARVIM